jgi:hypothetical protein
MSHTDQVPPGLLDDVAAQIGARIPLLLAERPPAPGEQVEITETFEVVGLSPDRVQAGSDDLRTLVEPTDRRHHQVAIGGTPTLYAWSAPRDGGAPGSEVVELAASPLAAELDRAITVIDALPADYLVRLLVAPAYHLYAFLLLGDQGETRVVVVRTARRLAGLQRFQPHDDRDFLAALRQVRPVVGMTPN